MSRRIGILGGMGPRSTAPFLERVLDEIQRQTDAVHDIDFPPIAILSWPTPFYVDRPVDMEALEEATVRGAKELAGMGVDFIAMPCNTAHLFLDRIRREVPVKVLDMVQAAADRLKDGPAALLGTRQTVDSGLYLSRSPDRIWRSDWQAQTDQLILAVKQGGEVQKTADELMVSLADADVHQVVIACTDLSPVLRADVKLIVVDAMQVLAEETVKEWLK